MSYRVQLTNEARNTYGHRTPTQRQAFDRGISDIADDPYRRGTAPEGKDPDRRTAAFGPVIVAYMIHGNILTVTVLHIIPI
ncbi:type II toxin-antitoxin system RelE/ParE family toxin (plasmid) [Embleya sp. NBC_00888]|uniref:type II toxin-antitoxin system RelE/ParE family toxin n=1 Tax=Embleya sp. NBC_00888 TaxID=2975960 RepID=UPI002F90B326|nr:type II toxin-antitoxin system RelE/ParE family toxin [Embleya sp. NBC_00888]